MPSENDPLFLESVTEYTQTLNIKLMPLDSVQGILAAYRALATAINKQFAVKHEADILSTAVSDFGTRGLLRENYRILSVSNQHET